MEHAAQVELIARVLALLEAKTTHMVEHAATAPTARYHAPAALERERALFRRLPLAVGAASQVARPGDFLTAEVAGVPLLVTRGADERVRAFINVCRHRGTRVEPEPCGVGKKAFVCPYHGWIYDLDGGLRHIPHEDGFGGVERARLGLVEVPCEARAGLVWVVPTPGASLGKADDGATAGIDVAAHLGPELARELEDFGLASHVVYSPRRFRKAFNWKIGIEIFFEAYHVKRTHADSIYHLFIDNLGLFDRFAPHLRNFFPKRSVRGLAGTDPSGWRLRDHGNLLYYLFPNTMLLIQPDHASIFHISPAGTDATDVHFYTLVPEAPTSEKATRYWDRNVDILAGAIEEDMTMGESIQAGVRSGANEVFHFGRFEQSLDFFQREVERVLAELAPA